MIKITAKLEKLIENYCREWRNVDGWSGSCKNSIYLDKAYAAQETLYKEINGGYTSFYKKAGPWTLCEGGIGAYRALVGTDGEQIKNRVAFIEKTPRIRVRPLQDYASHDGLIDDWKNWAEGPFKGDGPEDEESREWCDRALTLFGYQLA